jgi:large subunit ribosomal protein L21
MNGYAIAEIAGRQFRIEEGKRLDVPRLKAGEGETVELDKLLLVNRDGKVTVGVPYVDGAKATAKVVEHTRGKKVRVFKKKRRKGFQKLNTDRPRKTVLEIEKVSA